MACEDSASLSRTFTSHVTCVLIHMIIQRGKIGIQEKMDRT